MKKTYNRRAAIALALTASAILTGCGSNSGSNNAGIVTSGVVGVNGITGGCIPLTQPIVFSATGMAMDGQGDIAAGALPTGQAYGSVGIGTGTSLLSSSGITYIDTQFASQSAWYGEPAGTLELSFSSALGYNYGVQNYNNLYSGSSTMNGYMQLSNLAIESIYQDQQLAAELGGSVYSGYTTNYTQGNYCVSGIALEGYLYSQAAQGGFKATVWLYLNNTSHGYQLYWE